MGGIAAAGAFRGRTLSGTRLASRTGSATAVSAGPRRSPRTEAPTGHSQSGPFSGTPVWEHPIVNHSLRRDFDVRLSGPAQVDLYSFAWGTRREVIRILQRVVNDDLFDCHRIVGYPRGPLGSWIAHESMGWFFVAQWDQGQPDLWPLGQGRGTLTVEAIRTAGHAAELLQRIGSLSRSAITAGQNA